MGRLITRNAALSSWQLAKLKFSKLTDDQVERLFEFMLNEVDLLDMGIDICGGFVLPASEMWKDEEAINGWLDELKTESTDDELEEYIPDPWSWDYYEGCGGYLGTGFAEATRQDYIDCVRGAEDGILQCVQEKFSADELNALEKHVFGK